MQNNSRNHLIHSGIQDIEQQNFILEKIKCSLEVEKIYLNKDLHIESFSAAVGESVSDVSIIVRYCYQTGFVQLINKYRVLHAIQLLSDKEHRKYKVNYIGFLSGFKSRSAFYHAFTSVTGKSPAAYREELSAY